MAFSLGSGTNDLLDENITVASVSEKYLNAATPEITGQPSGTTVNADGIANLSVTAGSSAGTLSYQWYSNTVNSNTTGSLITGATSATYSAPNASAGKTYYYCKVTNTDAGAINSAKTVAPNTAMVTVNNLVNATAATITAQPQDITVVAG